MQFEKSLLRRPHNTYVHLPANRNRFLQTSNNWQKTNKDRQRKAEDLQGENRFDFLLQYLQSNKTLFPGILNYEYTQCRPVAIADQCTSRHANITQTDRTWSKHTVSPWQFSEHTFPGPLKN